MRYIKLFFLLIIFIPFLLQAQERVNTSLITTKGNLAYLRDTKELYTGIAEFRKKNGNIIFESEYKDGYKVKYTEYFTTINQVIVKEEYYYDNSFTKKLKIKYSLDHKNRWITHYDNKGKKTLEENYINNSIAYSCEYKDNKKHGKEFCTTKKSNDKTEYYLNGKKVKI